MNKPPVAVLTVEDDKITATAMDHDGEIVNYSWKVNDDSVKIRDKKGSLDISNIKDTEFTVNCRVTDNDGMSTVVNYKYSNGNIELVES
jgi:hypothetical protein